MAKEGTFLGELQRGWQRFWQLSWWWKGPIIGVVGFMLVVIVAAIAGGGDEDKPGSSVLATITASPTEAPVTEAPSETTTLTATPKGTAEPTKEPTPEPTDTTAPTVTPITYEIANRKDVSFGVVVRILYRVSVSAPLTEGDLRRIAQEIIDDETSQQDVNAIGFFFYLPGTDTTFLYTAGKADWAPHGDWASADTVQAGDYSDHELGAIDLGGP